MSQDNKHGLIIDKVIRDAVFVANVQYEVQEAYDGDEFNVLFALACRSLALYIEDWSKRDNAGAMASLVLNVDDLEDPNRVSDPKALITSLFHMAFESVWDNVASILEIEPE